jgi:hypothetical protein
MAAGCGLGMRKHPPTPPPPTPILGQVKTVRVRGSRSWVSRLGVTRILLTQNRTLTSKTLFILEPSLSDLGPKTQIQVTPKTYVPRWLTVPRGFYSNNTEKHGSTPFRWAGPPKQGPDHSYSCLLGWWELRVCFEVAIQMLSRQSHKDVRSDTGR